MERDEHETRDHPRGERARRDARQRTTPGQHVDDAAQCCTPQSAVAVFEITELPDGSEDRSPPPAVRRQYINLDERVDPSRAHPEWGRRIRLRAFAGPRRAGERLQFRVRLDPHEIGPREPEWGEVGFGSARPQGRDATARPHRATVNSNGWTDDVVIYLPRVGGDEVEVVVVDARSRATHGGRYVVWRKVFFEVAEMRRLGSSTRTFALPTASIRIMRRMLANDFVQIDERYASSRLARQYPYADRFGGRSGASAFVRTLRSFHRRDSRRPFKLHVMTADELPNRWDSNIRVSYRATSPTFLLPVDSTDGLFTDARVDGAFLAARSVTTQRGTSTSTTLPPAGSRRSVVATIDLDPFMLTSPRTDEVVTVERVDELTPHYRRVRVDLRSLPRNEWPSRAQPRTVTVTVRGRRAGTLGATGGDATILYIGLIEAGTPAAEVEEACGVAFGHEVAHWLGLEHCGLEHTRGGPAQTLCDARNDTTQCYMAELQVGLGRTLSDRGAPSHRDRFRMVDMGRRRLEAEATEVDAVLSSAPDR